MPNENNRYNVQCANGCVFDVDASTPLGVRCVEREKQGFLDALGVNGAPECEVCADDEEMRAISDMDYWPDFEDACWDSLPFALDAELTPIGFDVDFKKQP